MGLDLASEAQPEAPPAEAAQPEATRKRERAPLDADAREKNRQAAKVRRLLKAAKGAKSEDELFNRLDELRGRKPEAKPEAVAVQPAAPKVEAWEDPATLAKVTPRLAKRWEDALGLMPERYRPEEGSAAMLAEGTAPLVIKMGAATVTTSPEVQAAAVVALVVGPGLLSMLWNEALKPWWTNRKARAAKVAAGAPGNTVEGQVTERAP